MSRRVDVAVVGAGSAGLAALAEVRKLTRSFVLIDDGPLGTMCARVGCMPSKALIQVANDFHRRARQDSRGIRNGRPLRLSIPEALAYVRAMRDRFSAGVVLSTKRLGGRLVRGRARFVGPGVLRVGRSDIRAKRVVLATGSRPIVPEDMLRCGSRVVTTDSLFERDDFPARIGVVGLGPIGLEMGQALSRLGCEVVACDRSGGVGTLTDPAVNACATRLFSKEFSLLFGNGVKLQPRAGCVRMASGRRSWDRDLVLASLGRRPELAGLGLAEAGVVLGDAGLPDYDEATMKVRGFPIFLAGDAAARRPVLHEAADDGRIAGYNSVRPAARRFVRRAPLTITFSEPNLVLVGKRHSELERGSFVTGEARFESVARALILGEDYGLLHVYAGAASGVFLGAEMVGPAGEHLGHLMAWSLQQGLTVFQMLGMPFYHPTLEEGLRTALRDAAHRVRPLRAGGGARRGTSGASALPWS